MKRKIGIILIFGLVVIGIYLNRSYAHIYNQIDQMNLQPTDSKQTYQIGNTSQEKLVYVAMGDSLTAGVGVNNFKQSYSFQVAESLSKNNKNVILNVQAIPGAKSVNVVNKFLDSTIKMQPNLVTIFVGINDVHGNVSKEEFQKNYEILLKSLIQETKAKIYVINIPYIGGKDLILPPYNFYFDTRTKEFNEILRQLAVDYKINYINLYTNSRDAFAKDSSNYASDSFHPSEVGYKLWTEIIYAGINK